MAHGWLSLMFDSAFIFDETVDLETDQLTLQPYPAVWAAARGYFDEAISLANANSFTLPSTWINGNALTNTELVQLIHSQLARWIPQVARTPAQRDAVDWAEVISHVDQGITSDFFIQGDGGAPADGLWGKPQLWWTFESNPIWGRADYKTIGPADTSGGYQNWLATPVAQRTEFEMETADLRIVGPAGGRDPGTDFEWIGPSFFRPDRGTYHFSQYRGTEYNAYVANGFVGPMIYMTVTEMQLTKAEGLLRGGNAAAAVAIINNTRVNRGGLPPATATDTDLMDKLIYEKRIENYGVCVGCAYWDRRGWGQLAPTGPAHHNGLVEGTPLHFAMPGKEMEILQFPVYSYGGVGNEGMALSVVAGAPPAPDAGPGSRAPAKLVYAFKGLNSVDEKLQYVDEHLREARGTFAVH
jgi:hypothetical protein